MPNKKEKITPLNEKERIAYLLSNRTHVETYGNDVATSFVNLLRDETLTPLTRSDRISKRSDDLRECISDLQQVKDQTTDSEIKTLAKDSIDNLTTLLVMGDQVIAAAKTNIATENITTNNELAKSNELVYIHDESFQVFISDKQKEIVQKAITNGLFVVNIAIIAFICFTVSAITLLALIPLLTIIYYCLTRYIYYPYLRNNRVNTPIAAIEKDKFVAFYDSFGESEQEYIDAYIQNINNKIIHDTPLIAWVKRTEPVFKSLNIEDFDEENHTDENAQTTRVIKRLKNDFLRIIQQSDQYKELLNMELEKERRDALKEIESDKALNAQLNMKNQAFEKYLEEE